MTKREEALRISIQVPVRGKQQSRRNKIAMLNLSIPSARMARYRWDSLTIQAEMNPNELTQASHGTVKLTFPYLQTPSSIYMMKKCANS